MSCVNYQLYRTNTKLGGQMKWDLVIESAAGQLYIKDYHLTPISDSIPFNKYSSEELLKYPHQYNVQTLYKDIQGYFYDNCVKPECSHNWPIVRDLDDCAPAHPFDAHDGTLEMGCRRSKYQVYKKQFEFLCPVWIENLDDRPLKFRIDVFSTGANRNRLTSKVLSLGALEDAKYDFHNRFARYFSDYIYYIGLNSTDRRKNRFSDSVKGSDTINVDLSNQKSRIVGLNVTNGNIEARDINSLSANLIYRERPMIEFDNMIIDSYRSNNLITRQLFNFNICFNLEDLAPGFLQSELLLQNFSIEVHAYTGESSEEVFDIKDFYTNYDYIQLPQIDRDITEYNGPEDKINALNYLQDNKCVDFMNINKFSPNICHWSLEENNDYIFNLYNGLGSFYIADGKPTFIYKRYWDSPNIVNSEYLPELNNTGWISMLRPANNEKGFGYDDILKLNIIIATTDGTQIMNSMFTEITPSTSWINNIKYTGAVDANTITNSTRLAIASTDNENVFAKVISNGSSGYKLFKITDGLYVIILANAYNILYGLTKSKITLASVIDAFDKYEGSELDVINLKSVIELLRSAVDQKVIAFKRSVLINKTDSPSYSTNEVDYYKDDDSYITYLTRYDGNLRPTFISPATPSDKNDSNSTHRADISKPFNYVYYKKVYDKTEFNITDGTASEYCKYSSSGYEPLFPSIGYYALGKSEIDYTDIHIEDNTIIKSGVDGEPMEYKWYNNSKMLELPETILIERNNIEPNSHGEYPSIDDIILDELRGPNYNFDNDESIYVASLYKSSGDFDYKNDNTTTTYKYNITLELK